MSELFEYSPTRSNRAKWALLELGVPFDSHSVDFMTSEQQGEAHRSIHPLGQVPAYKTIHYTLFESAAIVMQLCDERAERGLAPAIGTPERSAYYQWCVFGPAELDHTLFELMKHTMHLPEPDRNPHIAQQARQHFSERAKVLSDTLQDQEYLLGSEFSGADIVIGYDCNWAKYTGVIDEHPELVSYYERLQQRPAFQSVFV